MPVRHNSGHHAANDTVLGFVVFAIIIAILAVLAWMSMNSGHGQFDWYIMPL